MDKSKNPVILSVCTPSSESFRITTVVQRESQILYDLFLVIAIWKGNYNITCGRRAPLMTMPWRSDLLCANGTLDQVSPVTELQLAIWNICSGSVKLTWYSSVNDTCRTPSLEPIELRATTNTESNGMYVLSKNSSSDTNVSRNISHLPPLGRLLAGNCDSEFGFETSYVFDQYYRLIYDAM
jgi:hypothetical protein